MRLDDMEWKPAPNPTWEVAKFGSNGCAVARRLARSPHTHPDAYEVYDDWTHSRDYAAFARWRNLDPIMAQAIVYELLKEPA